MHIEAIVIKKVPVREHDQLVVLYSRELGKCSVVARGSLRAHSKQALAIDEGNVIQCELVQGRGGFIMTGAQAMCASSGIKGSLARWAAAQFFLQVFDTFIFDEQPDAALWTCLRDILVRLDVAADTDVLPVFRDCQGKLLATLGYGAPQESMLDGRFEEIAQRRFLSLDFFYDMARRPIS